MNVMTMPVERARTMEFDPDLIRRIGQNAPRYTSYPTPDRFGDGFGYRDYLQAVASLRTRGSNRPLSLYIHIPFCDTVCYYCSCTKIVTRKRDKAAVYLSYLKREIEMQSLLFTGMNQVEQLRMGGGTPTYLSDVQLGELMEHLKRCFQFAPDDSGEYAIEVDPRTVTRERVLSLRRQGFNRISLGVQDLDLAVQAAVNRIQPEQETLNIIAAAREAQFRSVGVDLMVGLPRQNVISMAQTIDTIIAARPDRIALYNYAHQPQKFKSQRDIVEADLPTLDARLDMLGLCIRRLEQAGYVYIGMDHFARPDDDLAVAQRQGRLHRNFHGYSTHADTNLVACGVSAISAVAATYSQNVKTLDAYYGLIDKNELPVARGTRLNMDDALRRTIIQTLMCHFELCMPAVEQAYPISFHDYFAAEWPRLEALAREGLLDIDDEWLSVTPKGRLLIGTVCMVFDRYLANNLPSAKLRSV